MQENLKTARPMTTTAVVLYLIVAKAFLILTLIEGAFRNLPWTAARFSGLMLSAAWPVVMLAVAFSSRRANPRG